MAFNQFVGVVTPNTVLVGVPDRAEFEKINAEALDHRAIENPESRKPLLTKRVESEDVMVVFQHWLDE